VVLLRSCLSSHLPPMPAVVGAAAVDAGSGGGVAGSVAAAAAAAAALDFVGDGSQDLPSLATPAPTLALTGLGCCLRSKGGVAYVQPGCFPLQGVEV